MNLCILQRCHYLGEHQPVELRLHVARFRRHAVTALSQNTEGCHAANSDYSQDRRVLERHGEEKEQEVGIRLQIPV